MTDRPDWLTEQATVYAVHASWDGRISIRKRTVVRFTPTLVIVADTNGNEQRWRLSDLKRSGGDRSWDLAPPTDHRVITAFRRRQTSDAMDQLRRVHETAGKGAVLYNDDPEQARALALAFKDAAEHALAGIPATEETP